MWLKLTIIVSFCILSVLSRPNGAPLTACEDMMPRHSTFSDQPGNLPVTLEVPSQIVSGQSITIRLLGTIALPAFGGFQIQARTQNDALIGRFMQSEVVNTIDCRNITGSSATHININPKTGIDITWIPPITAEILVFNFHITIAGNFQTFWAARRSPFYFVIPSDPITTTSPTWPTEEPTTPQPRDDCNCNCNCNCNCMPNTQCPRTEL